MTSLPPPKTNNFPDDSLEKQVYNIVDKYSENIPVPNDRNRLGFNLYRFMTGEGDPPEVCIKAAKIKVEGLTEKELAAKLSEELNKIK